MSRIKKNKELIAHNWETKALQLEQENTSLKGRIHNLQEEIRILKIELDLQKKKHLKLSKRMQETENKLND